MMGVPRWIQINSQGRERGSRVPDDDPASPPSLHPPHPGVPLILDPPGVFAAGGARSVLLQPRPRPGPGLGPALRRKLPFLIQTVRKTLGQNILSP